MMFSSLPNVISQVDISNWENLPPEDLILKPALVSGQAPATMAARALKYSRAGTSDSYDEMGFRLLAATPCKGLVPLQTIFGMRLERKWSETRQLDPEVETLLSEQTK